MLLLFWKCQKDAYLQLSGQTHSWDIYWLWAVAMAGIISGLITEKVSETLTGFTVFAAAALAQKY